MNESDDQDGGSEGTQESEFSEEDIRESKDDNEDEDMVENKITVTKNWKKDGKVKK